MSAVDRVKKLAKRAGMDQADIDRISELHRTRAGSAQRSNGAWSWFTLDSEGREVCGSGWPLKLLEKYSKLEVTKPSHVGIGCSIDVTKDATLS